MDKEESEGIEPYKKDTIPQRIGIGLAYITLTAYFTMCRIDDIKRNMMRRLKEYSSNG